MKLVVYEGAPIEDNTSTEPEVEGAIEVLERELQEVSVEIGTVQTAIEHMGQQLRELNNDLFTELVRLQEELEEYVKLQQPVRGPEDDSDWQTNYEQRQESSRFRNTNAEVSSSKRPSARARKLFGLISKKTHPDKVQDPVLNELFIEAKLAYNEDDVKALEQILSFVKKRMPRKLGQLLNRLKALQEQRDDAKRNLEALRQSEQYKMLMDFNDLATRPKVVGFSKLVLSTKIKEVKAAINSIKPDKYPEANPKPQASRVITSIIISL